MKINLIVKLSIIFYTTTLLGSDKGQIAKKVADQIKLESQGESANSYRHFEALKRILLDNGHEDYLD